MEGSASLTRLTESVADGISIDWSLLDELSPGDPRRPLLEALNIVDRISKHHRSVIDDPAEAIAGPPRKRPSPRLLTTCSRSAPKVTRVNGAICC